MLKPYYSCGTAGAPGNSVNAILCDGSNRSTSPLNFGRSIKGVPFCNFSKRRRNSSASNTGVRGLAYGATGSSRSSGSADSISSAVIVAGGWYDRGCGGTSRVLVLAFAVSASLTPDFE